MEMKTPPTAEQVLGMMKSKMGATAPAWGDLLHRLAPDLLVATGMNSAQSVNREASSIPPQYRHLIAVAAALGRGDALCARSQAHLAREAGATAEEILDAVRITRHLMASATFGAAEGILKDLAG